MCVRASRFLNKKKVESEGWGRYSCRKTSRFYFRLTKFTTVCECLSMVASITARVLGGEPVNVASVLGGIEVGYGGCCSEATRCWETADSSFYFGLDLENQNGSKKIEKE